MNETTHRRPSRRLAAMATAILLALGLSASTTACGGDPESLTVYSGRSEKLIGPILEAFTADTGIALHVRYGSSNDLALLLAEEGDKSPADVFLSRSPGPAGFLDDLGMLAGIDDDQRLRGDAVAEAISGRPAGTEVFAVAATAGTTNLGIVDAIDGIADACTASGVWLHVDGAYGGAAMAAPSARHRFDGIERADSLVVDPHKWLFSPFDCAALVYANPALARAAHTQHAGYLEPIIDDTVWNPCDYANVLTRRARGMPFWFSLAVYGTDAYRDAIEHTLEVARATRDLVVAAEHLELVVEPELSVVAFRRRGWGSTDYQAWCDRLLAAGTALLTPTTFDGGVAMRICIVNPRTSVSDLQEVLATLEPAGDPVT